MTEIEFINALKSKARPEVAQEIATAILFSVDDSTVRYEPSKDTLETIATKADVADTPTIHCTSWQTLYGVLIGDVDLMEAFLNRTFWTNGYLPVVFRLFAVFQTALTLRIPE